MPSDPARYRTGRHNRLFVYLQEGPEPADSDPLVCAVWPPFAGAQIAALLNEQQSIADARPTVRAAFEAGWRLAEDVHSTTEMEGAFVRWLADPQITEPPGARTAPVPPAEPNTPDPEDDIATLAMHCKTYGDGEIWEAARRVMRLSAAGYRIVKDSEPTLNPGGHIQLPVPQVEPAGIAELAADYRRIVTCGPWVPVDEENADG